MSENAARAAGDEASRRASASSEPSRPETELPLIQLAATPWTVVEALRASGAALVAFLPIGSTEAHGPHLPLATDVIIAHELALRAAQFVSERSPTARAVVLPAIPYAPAEYARPFAGTLSISKATLRALVVDLARAVLGQGFVGLVIVNGHLEPDHVRNLRKAAEESRVAAPGLRFVVAPEWTSDRYRPHLPREFFEGGAHAGGYETSLVLAAEPSLVDDEARAALTARPTDLAQHMKQGAQNFREIPGGEQGYFGDPAHATASLGQTIFDHLAKEVAAEVTALLG